MNMNNKDVPSEFFCVNCGERADAPIWLCVYCTRMRDRVLLIEWDEGDDPSKIYAYMRRRLKMAKSNKEKRDQIRKQRVSFKPPWCQRQHDAVV